MVTISMMVKIVNVKDYVILCEGLFRNSAFILVLDSINFSARHWNSEQKLSFDEFACLIDFLTESSNKNLIAANKDALVALSLRFWLKKLEEWKVSSNIATTSSI